MRVGEGLKTLLRQKKEKKYGKQILCFRTKTAHIENYYLTQLVPFPKYCHKNEERGKKQGGGIKVKEE